MSSILVFRSPECKRGRPRKGGSARESIPAFTTGALIDTIIVRPLMAAPIHAATLHKRIIERTGFSSVKVEPFGEITDHPTITLQDATPARLGALAGLLHGLPVVVDRLDVALDCRPRKLADLDQLAAGLARHHVPRQDALRGRGMPRQVWGNGAGRTTFLGHPCGDLVDVAPRWTTYVGRRGGAVLWRVYPKRMDHGRPIPEQQRVARIEAEMRGDELLMRGLGTLADVLAFDFSKLTDLFKFASVAAPAPSRIGWPCIDRARRQIAAHRAAAGMWAVPKRQHIAFDRLNRAARRALQRLTDEFAAEPAANFLDTGAGQEPRCAAGSGQAAYNLEPYTPLPHAPDITGTTFHDPRGAEHEKVDSG